MRTGTSMPDSYLPTLLRMVLTGFIQDLKKLKSFFSRLKNSIYFGTFPSEVRPEFICEESLSLLEHYCSNTKLHFGAQSGSDRCCNT